jgi:hypothetical protein
MSNSIEPFINHHSADTPHVLPRSSISSFSIQSTNAQMASSLEEALRDDLCTDTVVSSEESKSYCEECKTIILPWKFDRYSRKLSPQRSRTHRMRASLQLMCLHSVIYTPFSRSSLTTGRGIYSHCTAIPYEWATACEGWYVLRVLQPTLRDRTSNSRFI